MTHPTYTARDIASLIDNDPIMASQIKEFMRIERLLECLDISPSKLAGYAKQHGDLGVFLDEAENDQIVEQIRNRM